jgi:hypothetical protein
MAGLRSQILSRRERGQELSGYLVNAGAGCRLLNVAKEGHGLSNIVSLRLPSYNSHYRLELVITFLSRLRRAL